MTIKNRIVATYIMRNLLLITGLLLLFATELLSVYFLMPFTDIQEKDAVAIAYFFHQNLILLRTLALALIAYPIYYMIRNKKTGPKLLLLPVLAGYVIVYYYLHIYMAPIEIYQPVQVKTFASKKQNTIRNDKLVIGVAINGIAKAYPVQILGYHHQIADTIGGLPVMITYCTLCRSARAYIALVQGKADHFVLMGLNKFNSVFEDESTKSWWQQETGLAIAGPMKGKQLEEVPSRQVTLSSWMKEYPDALVMQPDSNYLAAYGLDNDDRAFFRLKHLQSNAADYKEKSLVIGVIISQAAKEYDWDVLDNKRFIGDSLNGTPLLLTIENDNASFHVWNRKVNGQILHFEKAGALNEIKDVNTQSSWNMKGFCTDGALKGTQLKEIQSYLETWKSWNTFHPGTATYIDNTMKVSSANF